jgi:uncharacterized protein (TIGR00730 family)
VSGSLRVCVFCASGPVPEAAIALAGDVGTAIAARGWSLVSGGGRVSMMGAVARAAREGGARTVGVIPEALVAAEVADDDADELVVVADMRTRKREMDERCDAVLALPGGLGTLEELFEIWTARVLGMHDKPIAILDPYGLYEPLRELMKHLLDEGFARPRIFDAIGWTTTVAEAFDHVERSQVRLEPTAEDYLESEP